MFTLSIRIKEGKKLFRSHDKMKQTEMWHDLAK